MAGRSSKKSQDNFEKIKKEMSQKKRKAQTQKNPGIADEIVKNNDTIAGKELKEDAVEKVQQDEKENTADTRKIELVVFRVDEEEFALRLSNIKEIIRIPSLTKVPNAPQYITGLCSLRGDLLPVIDSRRLFGLPDKEFSESSRIIVADIHGKKVGLVSDRVSEVISTEEAAVKNPPASIRGTDGGVISGILILNDGKRVVMILNTEKIIKAGSLDEAVDQQHTSAENLSDLKTNEDDEEQIVIFDIGTEEYAFSIDHVKEIIRLPNVMKVPNAADYIEGVFSIRNQLLALISPGKLLGVDCKQPDEYSRVVIISNGSLSYGVVVDKVSHVLRVRKELFKESGQIANCSGSGFVKGIFSLNNGERLVMMLEPDKLICMESIKDILDVDHSKTVNADPLIAREADEMLEYVVFRLGEEEYGIEVKNVQEINRISEITRFPGAPDFIAGMVDLRGDIIPILNLRRLFAIGDPDSYSMSKFLVAELGKKRTGILIDSVSEVLRFSAAHMEDAPQAVKGNEQDRYIDKIAKLDDGKRIVLILGLSALLSFMQG